MYALRLNPLTGVFAVIKAETLIEFLDAVADTKFIEGPFEERGGVMLVGPPGSLKTTLIEAAVRTHTDALTLSDLNVQQWMKMKDEFVTRRYTCIAFPEFEKIYQRHPATALNLEGIIKALVSEGYGTGPGGDPRMPRIKARACIIGGITTDCFERHYEEWQKNGFLRRFAWMLVSVANPQLIVQAIRKWERISLGRINTRPADSYLEVKLSEKESLFIEHLMRSQPGLHGTGYVLMKKALAILKWKYGGNGHPKPVKIMEEIAQALQKEGSYIVLGED
jgi:hypothetical protein